jgi:hypothetical protein
MQSILLILAVVTALGFALWLVQAWRMLVFCRAQCTDAWGQLRAELAARREMIPYVVTAANPGKGALVDVIGNACDLAANVEGVRESSQAEARLGAALNGLLAQLDQDETDAANAHLKQLRERMDELNARIALQHETYNRQVDTFNALLDRAAGRLMASVQLFRRVDRF